MPNSGYSIPVNQPFPWHHTLSYLTLRYTPGLETITADGYSRHSPAGAVNVEHIDGRLHCPIEAESRVRILFDADCEIAPIQSAFAACPLLAPRLEKVPGLRIPGCWDPFELCMRVILGQQVSVKAACTLMGRLAAISPAFEPREIAESNLASLRIPGRRIQTIRSVAQLASDGALGLESWRDAAAVLKRTPGIGPWTIDYLAIRLGRDPDAIPASDLGLLRAAKQSNPRELLKLAERWRPYRAYAAMYLWSVPSGL